LDATSTTYHWTISLFPAVGVAQKVKTVMGDAWNGVVESADEATREIKIVNPNKKTETFVGVLKDGYKARLQDGTFLLRGAPPCKRSPSGPSPLLYSRSALPF
jgi:hypothetical protein